MATVAEVRDREVDRDTAGRMGWSDGRVDAELPVLFTDREWEVMMRDPAFGYVCRAGHALGGAASCSQCEAEAEFGPPEAW